MIRDTIPDIDIVFYPWKYGYQPSDQEVRRAIERICKRNESLNRQVQPQDMPYEHD